MSVKTRGNNKTGKVEYKVNTSGKMKMAAEKIVKLDGFLFFLKLTIQLKGLKKKKK